MRELLIVDRETRTARRWVNRGGTLEEQPAGDDGGHRLDALPVEVWEADRKLSVKTKFGLVEI